MEEKELLIPFKNYRTYVKIVNPEGKNHPLVVLHGGPGSTHNSLELLTPLAEIGGRPIIFYDQIGCGLSSKPDNHPELYNQKFWVEELENLLSDLHLHDFHLLGHSWGGMLEQLYMIQTQRKDILSLILSSTLSSAKLWKEETHILIKKMSKEDQESISISERENNYTSPLFLAALEHYLKMTVSDFSPDDLSIPECLRRKKIRGDVAYLTAWGPSEFTPLGNLKDYETTSFLRNIKTPSLVCYGSLDESTKKQNQLMYFSLGSSKKRILEFPNARHMTYFERNEEYLKEIGEWLSSND
ncbi:MAG TPA: alpha/beta hydrolase [Firmicutes bacterium]|nr:alpha/beta hydrolase [Bacillota bacterium]